MSVDVPDTLHRIAARGTDPSLLARLVGWLLQPRNGAERLRRACRDAGSGAATPQAMLEGWLPGLDGARRDLVARTADRWVALGTTAAIVGDPAYPAQLAAGWPHTDGPALLVWRGQPPGARPAVAIVGARRATGYGTAAAAWLAAAVARAGAHVLSGGAVGIDAAAHRAAVEEPGGTSVVLGAGHAVAYPRAHAVAGGLFDQVLDHGGSLIAELLPWEPPGAANVRTRNRILAGLADAVVVVEGSERSGALLTAGHAADRGVPVLAVPGDIRAPGSAAPHRLLAEGAAPCTGPADVLDLLGGPVAASDPAQSDPALPARNTRLAGLPDDVATILIDRWPRPIRVEDLAAMTGRSAPTLLAAVTRARVAGVIAESSDGVRLRRAPS